MDEAERCHKLAYIVEGSILARGTASEVIAAQGMHTWAIYGDDLADLSAMLQNKPGVGQTVLFGTSLHVSGKDGNMLEDTLRTSLAGTASRMEKIETSLEDVFIYMTKRTFTYSEEEA